MTPEREKPMAGRWLLIRPDGKQYAAETPLKCVVKEHNDRVPAEVSARRIREFLKDDWRPFDPDDIHT